MSNKADEFQGWLPIWLQLHQRCVPFCLCPPNGPPGNPSLPTCYNADGSKCGSNEKHYMTVKTAITTIHTSYPKGGKNKLSHIKQYTMFRTNLGSRDKEARVLPAPAIRARRGEQALSGGASPSASWSWVPLPGAGAGA